MRSYINKISEAVNRVPIAVSCVGIAVTAVSCFLQVFTRYILNIFLIFGCTKKRPPIYSSLKNLKFRRSMPAS